MAATLPSMDVESTQRDIRGLLARSRKSTRAIAAALFAGHVLQYNPICREWLAMTPAYVFRSLNVWTIATSAFLEPSAINVCDRISAPEHGAAIKRSLNEIHFCYSL
jgi:hypothetical protein